MARKLKVYGGTYDGMHRMIVAAETKRSAHLAMFDSFPSIGSYSTWDKWTSETGNEEELSIALKHPLIIFKRLDRYGGGKFERVK